MFLGTCPGLYTHNELFMISNQLLPGGKRGARRVKNQDIAQERYFRRVKSNLHVVVCLKYRKLDLTNSPEKNQLYKFPALVTRSCCVDIYRAWPHEALVSIAQKQLEEEESVFSLLPLKRREKDVQSAAVCSIMAHVHLSSRSMVRRIYGLEALKFYSPDTYLDFIDLFRKICKRLCLKEKVRTNVLSWAIGRSDPVTSTRTFTCTSTRVRELTSSGKERLKKNIGLGPCGQIEIGDWARCTSDLYN